MGAAGMGTEHWTLVVILSIGFTIILKYLPVLLRRWGVPVPQNFADWKDELERRAQHAIRKDAEAAEAKADLIAMIGEIPRDFDPTVMLSLHVAAATQRAILIEVEQRGIVREGTFQRTFGISIEEATTGVPPRSEDVDPDPVVNDIPNVRRIGGKLMPRRRL